MVHVSSGLSHRRVQRLFEQLRFTNALYQRASLALIVFGLYSFLGYLIASINYVFHGFLWFCSFQTTGLSKPQPAKLRPA